jgi:hypothetical protein
VLRTSSHNYEAKNFARPKVQYFLCSSDRSVEGSWANDYNAI